MWVVSATSRPLYPRERDPVPTVWAPGPVWTGAENIAPTRIRSLDRPLPSVSLYRLSYRGPRTRNSVKLMCTRHWIFDIGNKRGIHLPTHWIPDFQKRLVLMEGKKIHAYLTRNLYLKWQAQGCITHALSCNLLRNFAQVTPSSIRLHKHHLADTRNTIGKTW